MSVLLFVSTTVAVGGSEEPSSSQLWGEHGERWTVDGRLPDFSRAGYHRGERPIPEIPQAANVKDFGAVGDGVVDDTKAIQAAIAATERGAIYLPPGRYKITDFIRIEKSNIVLRGAGPERSVLSFPQGLNEVRPLASRTSDGLATTSYSFDGGFVTLQGNYQAKRLTKITATARRGADEVEVDGVNGIAVGQEVLVVVQETPDQSLKTFLYSGDPGDIRRGKRFDTKMVMRVTAVHGRRVCFDRPLRFDTRPEWQPEIWSFRPTVTECGVERLGFEFPADPYRGHFKEKGANAIELRKVTNCWIRNVAIRNADLGINLVACGNTLDGIVLTADPGRGRPEAGVAECTGHHAIQCKHSEDNLITRFDVRASYIHDLSVEHAAGNVYADGRGADLCFDHHKDTPYENLFTDIDCGAGTRVWMNGGGDSLGRPCAGWETFWNIRAEAPIEPPPVSWGVKSMNFVGLVTKTFYFSVLEPDGWWIEVIPPERLRPRNLHAAQLARRLSETSK
ncbi:MAG TPA: glycosyl hydrolase family 28-related protein [Opitutaceae bacterium]